MIPVEDYLHPLKTAYRKSPQWFKNTVGRTYSMLPRRIRYGSLLATASAFLEQSQWWSAEQLEAYQWEQLRALLQHAYTNVAYYRRSWEQAGVSPADIASAADMHKLPLLTKGQVRAHKQDLVATNYRNRLLAFNTGGSTGQPLEFYWERGRTRSLERAFMWRQWEWAGFEYGQRTAVLRGQLVREGLAHYDPIDQHLFLSSFTLSEETAPAYIQALRRFRPVSIQAYPSAITVLANYMKRHNEPPLDGLRVILAGSENLYPSQRALLEEVFRCRVYSWYGHGEASCLAGGCDKTDLYHVYPEYGFTELLDEQGQPLPWEPGVRGEIVVTGFNNWAMPFIRYRTGDIAVVGPHTCPCGRHYPLWQRIEGRLQEYIVGGDGRLVPLTAFIFGQHYHAFDKTERIQLVQNHPGQVTIRLVVAPDWQPTDERELLHDMRAALGHGWTIDIAYTDSIELTTAGKHRFVVQNIPLPQVWSGAASSLSVPSNGGVDRTD